MKAMVPVLLAAVGATLAVVLVVALEVGATGSPVCVPEAGGAMPICRPLMPASWALVLGPLLGGLLAGGSAVALLRRDRAPLPVG